MEDFSRTSRTCRSSTSIKAMETHGFASYLWMDPSSMVRGTSGRDEGFKGSVHSVEGEQNDRQATSLTVPEAGSVGPVEEHRLCVDQPSCCSLFALSNLKWLIVIVINGGLSRYSTAGRRCSRMH